MALAKYPIAEKRQSDLGFSKTLSIETVESLIGTIKTTLECGEDILVSGFGKFCGQAKRQRRDRNPATGQEIILKPRQIVTFRCSGKLRNRINA